MENQLLYLASLSKIDQKLDELNDEYGDLPQKVKEQKAKVNELNKLVEETKQILEDVKNFIINSRITLNELKDKEEKLSKQQFKVRNNKEFDAISKEIEHSRTEFSRITTELRTVNVKEENLLLTLEQQVKDLNEAQAELDELLEEEKEISSNQNDELNELSKLKKSIKSKISKKNLEEYKRIRLLHKDAVVLIKKNSCSGCYSNVPPQKIVEIRNNLDHLFYCEHCGRILYPEEIKIDKKILTITTY